MATASLRTEPGRESGVEHVPEYNMSSMFQNIGKTLQRRGVERQTFSIGWRYRSSPSTLSRQSLTWIFPAIRAGSAAPQRVWATADRIAVALNQERIKPTWENSQ